MPDLREILRQRNTPVDDSFEAKLEKSMAAFNKTLAPRINSLRLIGPAKPQMREEHRKLLRSSAESAISHCQFCFPPPKVYQCPKCDWETTDHWRMRLHNVIGPEWCEERAAKKARRWSQHA